MENTAVFIGHRYLPDEAAWPRPSGRLSGGCWQPGTAGSSAGATAPLTGSAPKSSGI